MLRGDLGDPSADRRGLVILHRRRRRARIVGRETCAACKHRENEREHDVPPHRFAVSVAHRASRRRGPRRERLILVGSGTFPAVHLDRHVRGTESAFYVDAMRATRAAVVTPFGRQQRDPAALAGRACLLGRRLLALHRDAQRLLPSRPVRSSRVIQDPEQLQEVEPAANAGRHAMHPLRPARLAIVEPRSTVISKTVMAAWRASLYRRPRNGVRRK